MGGGERQFQVVTSRVDQVTSSQEDDDSTVNCGKDSPLRSLAGRAAGVFGSRVPRTALPCALSSFGVPG